MSVKLKASTVFFQGDVAMYESSCSYQSALDLKRAAAAASAPIKSEDGSCPSHADWAGCAYRLAPSTFQQLKQSVEKAKAALQEQQRGPYLSASAFSDLSSPFAPPPAPPTTVTTQQSQSLQESRRGTDELTDKRSHGKNVPF